MKQDHVPTVVEIAAEIAALRELREQVPPRTAFGDDNLAQIDAQIDVLDNHLTETQIMRKYASFDEEECDATLNAAEYAYQWMRGTALDGDMSADWRSLAGVKVKPLAPPQPEPKRATKKKG